MAIKYLTKCGLMMASKEIQHGKLLGYLRHLVYRDCVFSQKFALRLNKLEVWMLARAVRKFWILILI